MLCDGEHLVRVRVRVRVRLRLRLRVRVRVRVRARVSCRAWASGGTGCCISPLHLRISPLYLHISPYIAWASGGTGGPPTGGGIAAPAADRSVAGVEGVS